MITETVLLRLPPPLSDAVDEVARRFVADDKPRWRLLNRWHGADLWMIIQDEHQLLHLPPPGQDVRSEGAGIAPGFAEHPSRLGRVGVLTRRLTVGAFSDTPDRLRFIPDWLLSTPDCRYIAYPKAVVAGELGDSIFAMTHTAVTSLTLETVLVNRVLGMFRSAWAQVQHQPIGADAAWEFIP